MNQWEVAGREGIRVDGTRKKESEGEEGRKLGEKKERKRECRHAFFFF